MVSHPCADSWQGPTDAAWSARQSFAVATTHAPGAVIVLSGGTDVDGDYMSDVWVSADAGASFTQARASAPFDARAHHSSLALLSGSVLVMGGRSATTAFSDVWVSSDAGASWVMVTASAPWGRRVNMAAVEVSTGRVVVCGGTSELDSSVSTNDVWWSDTAGLSWVQGDAAPWSQRFAHGISVVNHAGVERIVVAGGRNTTRIYNDVWATTGDVTSTSTAWGWVQLTPSAAWSQRSHMSMVALPDSSLFMVGYAAAGNAAWRSADGGSTWTLWASPWTYLVGQSVFVVNGSVAVIGGMTHGGTPTREVWRMVMGVGWADAPCSSAKRALCGVPAGTTPVVVALTQPGAGVVSPANAPAVRSSVGLYAPPRATVTLSPSQASPTPAGTLRFGVAFTAPVLGLSATHFQVHAPHLVVVDTTLSGSESNWELVVVVKPDTVAACPPGYTQGGDGATIMCGKAVETAGAWQQHASACAPFALATVATPLQLTFVASLTASSTHEYW